MKISSFGLAALSVILPACSAYYTGFNIAAQTPTGSCKQQWNWELNFNTIKSLPGNFTNARVYAASDCDTLANAVPAAISTGVGILVGIWTEDAAHYAAEKAALQSAITRYGGDWIISVSVGSEDLYRGDTSPQTLASQVREVRNILSAAGINKPIGHVDTWTAWTNGSNPATALIDAVDFIGFDAYPYFQSTQANNIANAYDLFFEAYNATVAVAQGKPVWITETGWPYQGATYGDAVPSVANAETFWKTVGCELFDSYNTFWYTLRDYYTEPAFGVVDVNFGKVYDLTC
ncbi:hypothetical protein MMC24_007718 [Lignoscripta atroalba]|nr:hypothetical protein [Lignoscripta atroalba]